MFLFFYVFLGLEFVLELFIHVEYTSVELQSRASTTLTDYGPSL